jgi:hypothetical protein
MTAENKEAGSSHFEQRTRELLMRSADALPGSVRSRLTQVRYAALAARSSNPAPSFARRWMPAGAMAGVVLALFVVLAPHGSSNSTARLALAGPPMEYVDMLTDSDALPLNGDQDVDYDFYEWAAEEAAGASSPAVGS